MKPLVFLFSIAVLFTACSTPKSPDFKTIKNARVISVSGTNYTVSADAYYNNPNSIGGELLGLELDVFIDDKKATHLSQTKSAVIQPETEFVVPITFTADIKEIIGSDGGFLKDMFKKLMNQELDVKYQGHLLVRFAGYDFKVPVNYTETVSTKVSF